MLTQRPDNTQIFLLAFVYCILNGHLQMRNLAYVTAYDEKWFTDPRFGIGVAMFFTGMYINLESDHILRNLRKYLPIASKCTLLLFSVAALHSLLDFTDTA